jgi:hypothetical protein
MEVEEDEDALLARLFFKRFGRALPEKEKEKDDVDLNMDLIDLTDEQDEEMEVAAPVVVKTEPIETPEIVANVANVDIDNRHRSFRLERLELAKARKAITEFGKTLRKSVVIPEKEAPLAAENVIADTATDMAEANTVNTIEMAERAIAESDAAIEANRKEFVAEFGDTNLDEFDD